MARSGPGPLTFWPLMAMEPPDACTKPATVSNSVLLPQPLEPTMVTNSPCAMSTETPSTAAKVSSLFGFLYSILRLRISIWLIAKPFPHLRR